jgi:hypothetical protein
MSSFRFVVALALLCPVAASQNSVWVVGPAAGPGVDFTSISSAVAAAGEGDTILVQPGSYPSFGVNGKSVAITAAGGATPSVNGGSFVVGLQAGQAVSLQGLQMRGDPFAAALNLSNNDGDVWVLDCQLNGYNVPKPSIFESGTNAVWSSDCASVVASHCQLYGGSSVAGEPAWNSDSSSVHLFGSTLVGGAGDCEVLISTDCGLSGTAMVMASGLLTAQSCTFQGGTSAPGAELCLPFVGCSCVIVSEGGLALELGTGSPNAKLYDVTLLPGGATGACGLMGTETVSTSSGTLDSKKGSSLEVAMESPTAAGDFGLLSLEGKPGDLVFLLIGVTPGEAWLPAWNGMLLIGNSNLVMMIGALPPTGSLSVPVQSPPLPAGYESVEALVQAARVSSAGSLLANPTRAVLLDGSF